MAPIGQNILCYYDSFSFWISQGHTSIHSKYKKKNTAYHLLNLLPDRDQTLFTIITDIVDLKLILFNIATWMVFLYIYIFLQHFLLWIHIYTTSTRVGIWEIGYSSCNLNIIHVSRSSTLMFSWQWFEIIFHIFV